MPKTPVTPPAPSANTLSTVTGSTGTAPLVDSTARGAIASVLMFFVKLAAVKTDALNDSEIADFSVIAPFIAIFIWGLWDKYIRPILDRAAGRSDQ